MKQKELNKIVFCRVKWNNIKIKKIADVITDNFHEQITDLLITYDIQTETEEEEDQKVDEVIKQIIKIYK